MFAVNMLHVFMPEVPCQCHSCSTDSSRLSREELEKVRDVLRQRAQHWKKIGEGLGFFNEELGIIENKPLLLFGAPTSWLDEMLADWYQWCPGDARGSKECANLESIKRAMSKTGLGLLASKL